MSANPTGPLHAGGGRWAAYGDALCNLLERCGHVVHREYYLNDRGVQMELFAASLAARKAGTDLPEDGYQGEYIRRVGRRDARRRRPGRVGLRAGEARPGRQPRAASASSSTPGSPSDRWSSPAPSRPPSPTCAPRGAAFDEDGAVWLRSTDYGDDKDRVLVKSDGEPTYLLPDIAYHRNKFARGYELLIDVWGADHHGYVSRLKAGVQALGHAPDELEIILGQLVTLVRGGEEVQALQAVRRHRAARRPRRRGRRRRRPAHLPAAVARHPPDHRPRPDHRAVEREPGLLRAVRPRPDRLDRPAGGRGRRRRGRRSPTSTSPCSSTSASSTCSASSPSCPRSWPSPATDRAPHKVTTWVRELADRFHGFYHDCYVIGDVPPELTQARLWLVEAARIGLAIGLDLLGVSAPESM